MPALDASLDEAVPIVPPDELAERALGGCAESLQHLFQAYRPRLVKVLSVRLGGHLADAEDVTQETLTKAFQQFPRFDKRYRFSTWLYTIAFRLAHDHRRKQRRYWRQGRLDDHPTPSSASAPPDVEASRHQEVRNLWETARRLLTDDQFTALWLRFGEDLSIPEVAHAMSKTQVGIRVLLHRARQRLIREENQQGTQQ